MSTGAQDAVPTSDSPASYHAPEYLARRIRHITGIQIVNLTPFPVRDAFATALSQPASLSQFNTLGNFSDDLDLTLLRKRSRRISSTSVNTFKSLAIDDIIGSPDEGRAGVEAKGRRKVQARPALSGAPNPSPGSAPGYPPTHLAATLHFDHSQRTLEKVIQSRLVETFITITVPEPVPPPSSVPLNTSAHARSRTESGSSPSVVSPGHAPPLSKATRLSRSASVSGTKGIPNRVGASVLPSTLARRVPPVPKAASSSSRRPVKIHKPSSSVPLQRSKSQQSTLLSSDVKPRLVPNYISSIHHPSTNPMFSIDPNSNEFAPHTNLSADGIKIELWARNEMGVSLADAKGKEKEVPETSSLSPAPGWKRLDEWSVALSELVPLPGEIEYRQSHLPSNTLVVTFSTSGESFYLPSSSQPPFCTLSRSRSVSPSGYNTDPEAEIRRFDRDIRSMPTISVPASDSHSRLSLSRRVRGTSTTAKTASSQQLLQLATLQSCILDTEESLRAVIKETDKLLSGCDATILNREASEREVRIQDRRADTRDIVQQMNFLRDDITSRRQRLQARRENLALAKTQYATATAALENSAAEVTEWRSTLAALRNRISPIRTSLVSILSAIYPIDLTSPSDLLYSILGVPLPIPLNGNEPAPPLSLSSHKEVTEDAVATALGYAAHLVQLLAVYMGKGLVYPVTYVGSRSLIKDNISAMVGPRMFPLFSKGVDTYRFEYAVFLLNKDIEMLMAERDLRALDMRHTLPNLKNLVLTLTDGECATILCHPRIQDSPSTSGLATPPRSSSPDPVRSSSNTPRAGRSPHPAQTELPRESGSPSSSGGTSPTITPTEGTPNLRYPKLILGLPPLPSFLRSRNVPSARPATRPTSEQGEEDSHYSNSVVGPATGSSESEESASPNGGEDDEDRQTIKGMDIHRRGPSVEGKVANGHVPHCDPTATQEKFRDGSSLTPPSAAIHVENGHQ